MVVLSLMIVFFVFSIGQSLVEQGSQALRDGSFWMLLISFTALASFVVKRFV